jgi:lipopolysaccharide export system permease protein
MTLASYYTRLLLRNFVLALVISSALFFIIDSLESSKVLMNARAPFSTVAELFLAKLQVMVFQITPLALLLSVVITLGVLDIRSETIAVQAGGMNLARFVLFTAVFSLPVVAGMFAMEEHVVPKASTLIDTITTTKLKSFDRIWTYFHKERNWFRGPSGSLFRAGHIDAQRGVLADLLVVDLDDTGFIGRRIDARYAVIRGDGNWDLGGARVLEFGRDGSSRILESEGLTLPFREKIADFRNLRGRPQQLRYSELSDLIAFRESRGIEAKKYLFERHAKIAVPFSALFVALAGAACIFALRGGVTIVRHIVFATAVCFVYWFFYSVGVSSSEAGLIPPLAAAWLPNASMALFAGVAWLRRQ